MNTTDPNRNQPTEKGKDNDSGLRDDSAAQPGTSTVSNSNMDVNNPELTKTAADDFREGDDDAHADASFDEVDYD